VRSATTSETERLFDLGDKVLALVSFHATGRGSGVPADGELAYLMTLRDGRVSEWGLFGDRERALEAAGVSG
jgi:ketosteroid isomerase-like protein